MLVLLHLLDTEAVVDLEHHHQAVTEVHNQVQEDTEEDLEVVQAEIACLLWAPT